MVFAPGLNGTAPRLLMPLSISPHATSLIQADTYAYPLMHKTRGIDVPGRQLCVTAYNCLVFVGALSTESTSLHTPVAGHVPGR